MAFRGDSTDTYTYASNSTGGTVDLGARNNYRYINASNVYNKGKADGYTTHTGTYTFPSNDTGGTKDLGVSHTYRYVNATNVYNKGYNDNVTINHSFNIKHTYEASVVVITIIDLKTNATRVNNKSVQCGGSWAGNPMNVNETVDGVNYSTNISTDGYNLNLVATKGTTKTYTRNLPNNDVPNWSYGYNITFNVLYASGQFWGSGL